MGKKLYVGNLSYDTTEAELSELFSAVAPVASVTVVKDRDTGNSKGFAFVEMETQEGADQARRDLNGKTLNNRDIRVDEARPPRERSFGGGGYGGGRSGGGGYGGGGYGGGRGGYGGGKKRGPGGGKKRGSPDDYGGY